MLTLLKPLIFLLSLTLVGCSGGSDNTNNPPPTKPPQTEILQNIMDLPISVVQMLSDGNAQTTSVIPTNSIGHPHEFHRSSPRIP